jgi:hypothetical protein
MAITNHRVPTRMESQRFPRYARGIELKAVDVPEAIAEPRGSGRVTAKQEVTPKTVLCPDCPQHNRNPQVAAPETINGQPFVAIERWQWQLSI